MNQKSRAGQSVVMYIMQLDIGVLGAKTPDLLDSPRSSMVASDLSPDMPPARRWSDVHDGVNGRTPVTRHRVPFSTIIIIIMRGEQAFTGYAEPKMA